MNQLLLQNCMNIINLFCYDSMSKVVIRYTLPFYIQKGYTQLAVTILKKKYGNKILFLKSHQNIIFDGS